jgi:hypothetical protein
MVVALTTTTTTTTTTTRATKTGAGRPRRRARLRGARALNDVNAHVKRNRRGRDGCAVHAGELCV